MERLILSYWAFENWNICFGPNNPFLLVDSMVSKVFWVLWTLFCLASPTSIGHLSCFGLFWIFGTWNRDSCPVFLWKYGLRYLSLILKAQKWLFFNKSFPLFGLEHWISDRKIQKRAFSQIRNWVWALTSNFMRKSPEHPDCIERNLLLGLK